MKRDTGTLIGENVAYAKDATSPMANIIGTGQHGYVHDIGSVLSNTAYVQRPLVCVLLNSPRGFRSLPNPEIYHATLKELMENGSRTITGLRATLTVDYTSNQIGHGTEVQEDIAKVTRERSVPVHTFTERYGKPINRFFTTWIEYLIGSGDNSIPKISVLGLNSGPADLLPDNTTATCMYIEPDPLHKTVVEAWLITNMSPKTGGQVEAQRDLSAPGQSVDYSIEFTGMGVYGAAVRATAQRIWDQINFVGADTGRRETFMTGIDADVEGATDAGYQSAVDDLKAEQI